MIFIHFGNPDGDEPIRLLYDTVIGILPVLLSTRDVSGHLIYINGSQLLLTNGDTRRVSDAPERVETLVLAAYDTEEAEMDVVREDLRRRIAGWEEPA